MLFHFTCLISSKTYTCARVHNKSSYTQNEMQSVIQGSNVVVPIQLAYRIFLSPLDIVLQLLTILYVPLTEDTKE